MVAPRTGDTLERKKGVEGQGVRECPSNGRERGESEEQGRGLTSGSWQLAGQDELSWHPIALWAGTAWGGTGGGYHLLLSPPP